MSQLDKFKASMTQVIAELLRHMLPPLDYWGLQPCKIIKQNANGTVCVRPNNPNLKDLDNVPIRSGVPGLSVEIQAGSFLLLGFEGHKPNAPIAYLWQMGTVNRIKIDAGEIVLNGGTRKIARDGDPVNMGTLTGSNAGGAVIFVYTPPGGPPNAPNTVIPINGGKITNGANGVLA